MWARVRAEAYPDYEVSKVHLLLVDFLLYYFHMVLVAITVEEAKCRMDPARPNALNLTQEERASYELPPVPEDAFVDSDDDDHAHLLPHPHAAPRFTGPDEDERILPSVRLPVAVVRWGVVWGTAPRPE